MESVEPGAYRLAGALLLTGGIVAVAGAMCPPYRQWTSSLEDGFRAIAGNPIGWWCIHAGFFLGTVLAASGLAALAAVLHRRGGGDWSVVAAVAFAIAGTAWIANLGYRVSIWNWAAEQFVATGATPDVFFAMRRWAGMLFVVFSLVGYGSVAALGVATLQDALGPVWLRWATLVCGVTGGFVVGANVPFIMYLPFIAWGVVLLRAKT
jgi:hypothetical protein